MAGRRRVCIVGGGVIGLSTAYRLITETPNVDVTVISEHYSPDTTGDGSAGLWTPYCIVGTPEEKICKWGKETYDYLHHMSMTPEGGQLGIYQMDGYEVYKKPEPPAFWKDVCLMYRPMTGAELNKFQGGYKYGYAYTTMFCECKSYLPWLMKNFVAKGGRCIHQRVDNIADISEGYDVVVNCTGVWAGRLVNDSAVTPLKGQLIKVDAPWLKFFVMANEDDLYILAGTKAVALGGTHEEGNWTKHVDPAHRERIWKGCCRLVPSLENARVVEEWVGLRPGRTSVRLEKDTIQHNGKTVKVVHNYGHGGSGVTLHWGCAGEAVRLIQDQLDSLQHRSAL